MNWLSHWDEWLDDLEFTKETINTSSKKDASFTYIEVTEDEIIELFKD